LGRKKLSSAVYQLRMPLRLLWTMTLGWKTGLTNKVYEPFMRSGMINIFRFT
jgi:hypothetical protein